MVRDQNNFAIFRGSKTGEGGANESDMEFSASGTIVRDKDLVTFAFMWVVKLISEEHKYMKIINVGGRLFPFFMPQGNEETETESSDQENENPDDGINLDISGPFNDIMRNFADLMDHFLQ